jgi:hypothetical protein
MNTKQNKIKLFLNLEDINKPKIEITETQDKDIKMKLKLALPLSLWNKTEKLIKLNKDWTIRVSKLGNTITELAEHRQDIIHDVRGILEQDEHFVPRI